MAGPLALAQRSRSTSVARPLWALESSLTRSASFDFALIVGLGVAGLVLSLLHPWSHAYIGNAQYGDAAYWDATGEAWARGYINAKAPDIRPGYSAFLGIIYSLFGADFKFAFGAQALLYAVGVAMVYAIGKQLGGRLVGIVAAVLLMLDPYMWEWTATSTTELIGSVCNLGALYFTVRALRGERRIGSVAAAAVCLGLANVVRPISLPFLVVVILTVCLRQSTWRWRISLGVIAIAACVVSLAPATLYEYLATGEANLSSDSAANLFAASSPKYGTWTPAIYDDVGAQLKARGIAVTADNLNAEFMRQTIQNYLAYPGLQVQRIAAAFRIYGTFDGESERPAEYGTFYRPLVLSIFALLCAGTLALRGSSLQRYLAIGPALVLAAVLFLRPDQALDALTVITLAWTVVASVRSWRGFLSERVGQALIIGLFWLSTGFLAIISTGIVGFILNRLYTQVEPERALILALGTTGVVLCAAPRRTRARVRSVRDVVRVFPGFPATVRAAGPAVAMLVVAMCILGAIRLALANIAPPEPSQAFVEPSPEQLSGLAERLGLPQTPQYITADSFPAARYQLVSGKLPAQPAVYAVPGEFTRFLWNLSDYNRTIYWYVFSDHVRPTSLDLTRTRITAESVGNLTNAQFGNRQGLLIIFAESSYFDATGDIAQQNVLTARAFIPWDASSDRFLTDAPVTFPLNVPLYDDERYAAASIVGTVAETGPLRVQTGGRLFRALSFQPNAAMTDGEVGRQAAITYHNLWVPQSGHLQGWIALHPRLFGNASIGPLHVQVRVIANGATTIVSDYQLNPTNTSQRDYEPMDADLSAYGNETIDVQLRVLVSTVTGDGGEVLFGEPNLSVSN